MFTPTNASGEAVTAGSVGVTIGPVEVGAVEVGGAVVVVGTFDVGAAEQEPAGVEEMVLVKVFVTVMTV